MATKKKLKAPFGKYSIDSNGNVWSMVGGAESKVKPRDDKDGYLRVNLADGGTSKNGFKEVYIHKLVAKAFCGGGKGLVLHADGNRKNNKASNLSYGSISKNAKEREQHKRERADSEDEVDVEDLLVSDVLRLDARVKAEWQITPEGYLVADRIIVAQSKVYEYADKTFPDGQRREFVTVEALESLANSLVGKPLTDEHPASGNVDARTWRTLARGTVQAAWVEHPSDDNDLEFPSCVARAVISDKDLIEKVLTKNIREVSPGYNATLSRVPDVSQTPDGGGSLYGEAGAHFLQTSRAGNHLAVVSAGRGGAASAIRLDSLGHAYTEDAMEKEELQKKLDATEKAMQELQAKNDAAQAKIDAFEADMLKKKTDAEEAEEAEKVPKLDAADFVALYNDRKKTEELATRLDVKFNEKLATQDIKKAVIAARLGADFRRLDSVTEVDAAFEAVVQLTPAPNSPSQLSDAYRRADAKGPTAPSNDTIFDVYKR